MAFFVFADIAAGRGAVSPRVRSGLFAVYAFLFAIGFYLFVLRQWQPLYGRVWPAMALAYFGAFFMSAARYGGLWNAALIFAGLAAALIMAISAHALTALLLFAAGAFFVFLSGLYKRDIAARAPALHLGLTAASGLLLARLFCFYFHIDEYPARILNQAGVTAVYTYAADNPVTRMIHRSQVYSITGGCRENVFYLTTRRAGPGLVEYHSDTGETRAYRALGVKNDISNKVGLDCARKRLYAGMYGERKLYVYDISGGWARDIARIRLSGGNPLDLLLAPDIHRLFITDEEHTLHIIDTAANKEIFSAPGAGKYVARQGRFLALIATDRVHLMRLSPDARRARLVKSVNNDDGTDQGAVAAHPREPLIFINRFLPGEVWARRLPGLERVRDIPLYPGLRFLAVSPDGRLLATVNNIRGNVTFIDTRTFEILSRVNVGARARDVTFSRDGQFVFVPSAAGGFRITAPRP